MSYKERFWKKNWDKGLDDLDPNEFETTYVDLIKPIFEKYPDKIALTYKGVEITFRALDNYSNQFANMLVENGFNKGDIIAINLPNTPEFVIAVIGALRVGCIVSGISPLLSPVQIQYQLSDLGTGGKKVALLTLDAIFAGRIVKIASELPQLNLVIATSVAGFLPKIKQILGKLMGKVPKGKVTPLPGKTVIDFHKDVLNYSTESVDIKVMPDDLVYIQYTGGTTGPPKGAMINHRNIVSNIKTVLAWLDWEEGKGPALSAFPMFHIAGLTFATYSIVLGWTQCLVPNPRDSDHICEEMSKYNVTVLVNVPSLYQILMKNPKFREMDHSNLGYCISAASPFPKESQEEFESIVGVGKLLELFGMTETSPVATMNPSKGLKKLGTVGMPILNVDCKIIDPGTGEEVPIGEPGELCIKGPLVMQGYYNKPEETKNAIDANGYMHTGDIGVMDEDGYIKIVDRMKDMIIVGGYKVFSSKVEDILTKHPATGMIALIGVPNPERPGSELVKAFIQLNPDFEYDGDEQALKEDITNFAKEKCAPYEVPKIIEIVEELPLTLVGKVHKRLLREEKD
ncbi:MAG: AMP-binding protein [Candidatus Hermodarchaeota archaeon]